MSILSEQMRKVLKQSLLESAQKQAKDLAERRAIEERIRQQALEDSILAKDEKALTEKARVEELKDKKKKLIALKSSLEERRLPGEHKNTRELFAEQALNSMLDKDYMNALSRTFRQSLSSVVDPAELSTIREALRPIQEELSRLTDVATKAKPLDSPRTESPYMMREWNDAMADVKKEYPDLSLAERQMLAFDKVGRDIEKTPAQVWRRMMKTETPKKDVPARAPTRASASASSASASASSAPVPKKRVKP